MSGASESLRILFVDDDSDLAELTATFLERDEPRFTVVTAAGSTEGLALLETTSFDCVVSDYDMPGQNGLEFLETIRATGHDCPFILYTGKGSEEIASKALSMGVTDYRQKASGSEHYELLARTCLNAINQYRAEVEAKDLDRIRSVIQDVNQALVRSETQAALDERLCEIIADAEPYRFAWIGTHDRTTNRVIPRASAGIDLGYLDEIEITTGGEATGRGPTGRAVNTRELQVLQDIREDPAYGPWRTAADERGFRSSAAIPLVYEDELLGVLNVYADRPQAFDDAELGLLSELGDDVAYATHMLEIRGELQDTMDRLERQNERLNEFTALVSHDLRNPLGVAQGRLELAREQFESKDLATAAFSLDRMNEIIEDLLELARVGRTSTKSERLDLASIAENCWRNVDTADATLVIETDRRVWGDPRSLKQCLENLMGNAINYGGEAVTLTVGDLADDTGFYIEDDGPGIPADERSRVFEAGYSSSQSGTGFGLAIVSEIAETHDWDLTVNEGTNGGARFEFRGVRTGPT